MNRNQKSWLRSVTAWCIALVMLLSALPFGAGTAEEWGEPDIRLRWSDSAGNQQEVQAQPIDGMEDAFWARVPAEVLGSLSLWMDFQGHEFTS